MRALGILTAALIAAPTIASAQATPVRWVTAARVADDAARDSAIAKLEGFLQEYPTSNLRPNALFQLGELLVRRADEEFAQSQRGTTPAPTTTDTSAAGRTPGSTTTAREGQIRPNYAPAIARYEELVRNYPNFDRIDAAAYTLGTLYNAELRYADAARAFEMVTAKDSSRFRGEAFFRLGDAYFELAAKERGTQRRSLFARAATAYEQATQINPKDGDIYFLALYKLGWSYYNQATQTNQTEYQQAVNTFGQLVDAYDKLTPEQQSRLGLRGEAIEYMAIAFTQVGGAEAANRYFASHGGAPYQTVVLRRVATSLRDQGDFPRAVQAYRALLEQTPTDSAALSIQREIVDIYQNRMLEPDSAQAARLRLAEMFAPGSAWAQANPGLASQAATAREEALRQGGQSLLASAQQGNKSRYAEAAQVYSRYLSEFAQSDSAQAVNNYYAAALMGQALSGQGDFAAAGAQFARTAFEYKDTSSPLAQAAGQNAIVAYDSALSHNKSDRATQDAFFSAVDRFATQFQNTDLAKKALIQEGRRASETQRWDVLERTFQTYAQRYPDDAYTPTAQKLVGDALYKQGKYAEAQVQWEAAQNFASTKGRRALADTIATLRTQAAATFADTLVKQGNYERAAEEVYVALADKAPQSERAPGALRDAIETYMLADSAARARGDNDASLKARQRAIDLANRLVSQYPNYQYRLTYQALAARLLGETGQRDQAVTALQSLIADNRNFPGRADAMVQLAVTLDSMNRKADAAKAYEEFAAAYPKDKRAADAQYNAAVTYGQANDNTNAARAFAAFASRFPRDPRAAQARQQRIALLQQSGDSSAANAELARLCSGNVSEDLRTTCAARTGDRYFRSGASLFSEYQQEKLVITGRVTAAAVTKASQRKQRLLKQMSDVFRKAIESGDPKSLAASTYYLGLAQWEYGEFLKNVQLPESLTEAQRAEAQQGAAAQAEQFYNQAKQTWQALIQKADQEDALKNDAGAQPWLERARNAVNGNVDTSPPTASRTRAALAVGE
ncbi:MAG: tetratricopeptide repeat protein [Gemmatimonadaceae bacterium]|nr:tetratricopeptide repeat protein [Gemmatimonadaceae bacterium]NUR18229.1 tetratricopeptide repeat protein [Gemmatimonadaceae bacterium]NUS97604.1 tetratricopeptide repeat protein [Gemmatimonadaceae bacterium]